MSDRDRTACQVLCLLRGHCRYYEPLNFLAGNIANRTCLNCGRVCTYRWKRTEWHLEQDTWPGGPSDWTE